MTRILAEHPKDVMFVFDSYDIYRNPITIHHIRDGDRDYEVCLSWQEALELGTKLIELAQNRKTLEEG